jgi:hypothetical protein
MIRSGCRTPSEAQVLKPLLREREGSVLKEDMSKCGEDVKIGKRSCLKTVLVEVVIRI